MHHFQIMALKNLCKKLGLDPQLIDNTLSYEENKKYLLSLVMKDLDERTEEADSYTEWYMKEHFLSYYIMRKQEEETT